MKEIIIELHIGIGQLKLGMTSDELENALLQMKKQWSNSSDEAMQMECCAETDDPNLITGRYMDNDSFFLVQYRNRKATEIGIQRELSKVASIKLFGLDMFNTTAECIIDSLMKKDNVICNEKDLQLGTEYIFPPNWSPTLERASISSKTTGGPTIHGRNAGGIRRRIPVSVFSDGYHNRLNY